MKRLLAKSDPNPDRPGRGATLPAHCAQVVLAAAAMLDTSASVALERAALDRPTDHTSFRTLVLMGALLHDIGKANDHFQKMVRGERKNQLVRHEALSALLALCHPPLHQWIAAAPGFAADGHGWLLEGAVFAAAGHHLKFHARTSATGETKGPVRLAGAGREIEFYLSHEDFAGTLAIGRKLGLASPPVLSTLRWKSFNPLDEPNEEIQGPLFDPERGLLAVRGRGARWWNGLDERQKRLFALAKAWVVAADVAGSALAREDVSIPQWLTGALARAASHTELEAVVAERLKGKRLRAFQQSIAASNAVVTLVEAGCGTGKTAAAYAWAAARGLAGQGGKVFFAYPTTGTATEGFIGYVSAPDTVEARLVHGRASIDIERLLTTREQSIEDAYVRNETLQHLEASVVVCTVDTVLGLVQNLRRGLFLSPAISTGRFVFDEIHAYDDRLFSALLDFLRTFPRAPVLLMSASIPAGRRAAIEQVTGPLAEMPRPTDVEGLPRYEFGPIVSQEHAWLEIEQCLKREGKVLWVSNTVGRAISAGRDGLMKGFTVRCYHSRYRYEDRVERHREVVCAFEPQEPATLVVTTQVAEMSLDLSADLLVTDLAPVPALVQRLGRLNRRASPEAPGSPRRAVAVRPDFAAPYLAENVRHGELFWQMALQAGRVLSQRDINTMMHEVLGPAPWPPEGDRPAESVWLHGGYESRVGELRKADTSATVLLQQDIPRIEDAARRRQEDLRNEILRCAVAIRAKPAVWAWKRHPKAPFHPIAPPDAIHYSSTWGAEWTNETQEESYE